MTRQRTGIIRLVRVMLAFVSLCLLPANTWAALEKLVSGL